jgi:hypothetical protein
MIFASLSFWMRCQQGAADRPILTLSSPPPVREGIQKMAHRRGDTGDDGNQSAQRHDNAEQHECRLRLKSGGTRATT